MNVRQFSRAFWIVLLLGGCSEPENPELEIPNSDPERGREQLAQLECGACHIIPGVPGAWGRVGPPLQESSKNVYIAGRYPNTPQVLMRFVKDAPSMSPNTAMPAIAMTDAQSRDIAAYLYSLR